MMDQPKAPREDEVLADAFGDLRNATRADAPTFERVLHRRRPKRGGLHWLPITAALAVMAGSTWWLAARPRHPTLSDAYNVARWDAPTDFLLDSRTRDWFRAVPVFGVTGSTAPEADQPTTTTDSSVERRTKS
jgi:hypothetical protein